LLSLILIAGFLSGIYLIWRDGFALAPFLTSAVSLTLLIAGYFATRKKG
jgi:hypothetical protein